MVDMYYNMNNNTKLFNSFGKMESKITNLQNYIPIYTRFFNFDKNTYNNCNLNQKYSIKDIKRQYTDTIYNIKIIDNVKKQTKGRNSFFKYSPILNSIDFMSGKYRSKKNKNYLELPKLTNNKNCFNKALDINNMAYTDGLFYYLSSMLLNKYSFYNGIDFYGSFLGIKNNFEMVIDSNEMTYLSESSFFHRNNKKLFHIENFEDDELFSNDTRKYRTKLRMVDKGNIEIKFDELDDNKLNSVIIPSSSLDLSELPELQELTEEELVIKDLNKIKLKKGNNMSDDSDDYSDDDSDDDSGDDEYSDSDDDDVEYKGIIYNFPVQIICLEKLKS